MRASPGRAEFSEPPGPEEDRPLLRGGRRCPLGAENGAHPPRGFQTLKEAPGLQRKRLNLGGLKGWCRDFSGPHTPGVDEGGLRGACLNNKDETHTPQTGLGSTKPASGSADLCARAEGRGGAWAGRRAKPGLRRDRAGRKEGPQGLAVTIETRRWLGTGQDARSPHGVRTWE